MNLSHLFALLGGILINSSIAYAVRWRSWPHHIHHHKFHMSMHLEPNPEPSPQVFQWGDNGCSCQLFVDETEVFRRKDPSGWYSCTGLGVYRCEQYCTEMFQDENLRFRSRQDSCDVIGREIYTPWYRKNQVCGPYGPYQDTPLQNNLCCRRGRPSDECEEESRT